MLEYLNLKLDGLGVGESSLNIWMKNGRLKYSYDSTEYDNGPSLVLNVSRDSASSFLESLDNLHLYRWKEQYFKEKKDRSEEQKLSSRWYLFYKEKNGEAKEFQGSNVFPKDWEKLMEAIAKLTADMDHSRFNGLMEFTMDVKDIREQIFWNPVSREENCVEVEYRDFLSVSRESKKLLYQQFTNGVFTVKHEYNIPNIVDYLLGNIERYFTNFSESDLPEEEADDSAKITICLYFENGKRQVLRRTYDRYGLPDDWDDLLEDFHKTLAYYGVFGTIFDSGLYHHGVKKDEHIYLSCIFEPNGKSYYYRSREDNLAVGDFVLVPSSRQENAETVVMISEILYCKEEEVPYPLEKTKFILRKLDDGDFYSFLTGDNPDRNA